MSLRHIMGCVSAKNLSTLDSPNSRTSKTKRGKKSSVYIMDLSSEEEALFVAISFGKIHRIASLLEKIDDVNIRSPEMMTPLVFTCNRTHGEMCSHVTRMLLKQKSCDVNAQDKHGRTGLMYACMNKANMDTVRILARCKKCDTNMADDDGYTALMHAVANGNNAAVEILLFCPRIATKTDINTHNLEGTSAVDLAVTSKNKECCQMLVKRAGADISHVHDIAGLNSLLRDTSR